MGKIIAYCKINCGYSNQTSIFLQKLKLYNKSFEIISILTDDLNVLSIGGIIHNITKNEFFNNYIPKTNNVDLNNHKTFPVIIYEKSNKKKYFIGGNDKMIEIYNKASMISDIEISKQHSLSVKHFTELKTENEKRLYCYFLNIIKSV